MVKALILLLLAVAVFGSAAYWSYELYLKPQTALTEEKKRPPEPPPPDPSLADFEKCALLFKARKLLDARSAFAQFIEQNPQSTKLEEARQQFGEVNALIFLTPMYAPEKEEYVVRSGDVLNKVAARMKTTPELILRSNRMTGTLLRIGQRLMVSPGEFSMVVNKRLGKVTLLNRGKFFRQYPILTRPGQSQGTPPVKNGSAVVPSGPKLVGKVSEKIAWAAAGQRVTFSDKEYADASHWIALSVGGNTLYSDPGPDSKSTVPKPPGGLGLAPAYIEELAALLRKGDPVIIEP